MTDAHVRGERRLGWLVWPEVAAALAAGPCVALVPLGATEQHGPHLPFATDTWIGDALVKRLAARLPGAVACPTLPFGCSREHLGFPGRSISAGDARRGVGGRRRFARAPRLRRRVPLSAHGGNYAELAAMLPALRAAAKTMWVGAFTDLDGLTATQARVAAAAGITPRSPATMPAKPRPRSCWRFVRRRSASPRSSPAIPRPSPIRSGFSTRASATTPRPGRSAIRAAASAARAEAYLEAWVELLADAYRRAKNEKYANGTESA